LDAGHPSIPAVGPPHLLVTEVPLCSCALSMIGLPVILHAEGTALVVPAHLRETGDIWWRNPPDGASLLIGNNGEW
jgi:hypothetical protein